jgi:hypothetical protein
MAMIRLLSGRFLEGKRIRSNNSAHFSLGLMTRCLLVTLFLASDIAIAQEPSLFRAAIDNWGGHNYTVELRDGKLIYTDGLGWSDNQAITVTPSPEQWRAFRRSLDAIPVWSWHDEYFALITDGTSWSFSIRYLDHSLATHGGNCYPDAHGSIGPAVRRTVAFQQFESAVEALLGGKRFRSEQDAAK